MQKSSVLFTLKSNISLILSFFFFRTTVTFPLWMIHSFEMTLPNFYRKWEKEREKYCPNNIWFGCKRDELNPATLGKIGDLLAVSPYKGQFTAGGSLSCLSSFMFTFFGYQFSFLTQILSELFLAKVVTVLAVDAVRKLLETGAQRHGCTARSLLESGRCSVPGLP